MSQFLALLLLLLLLGSNKVMVVVFDIIAVLLLLLLPPPEFSAVGEEVMASCFGDGQKDIPAERENTTSDNDDETAQKDFCSLDMLVSANPKYTAVTRISLTRDFVLCSR